MMRLVIIASLHLRDVGCPVPTLDVDGGVMSVDMMSDVMLS